MRSGETIPHDEALGLRKPLWRKGYPAQGQQQNYRSEQDKRATIMMIAARLL